MKLTRVSGVSERHFKPSAIKLPSGNPTGRAVSNLRTDQVDVARRSVSFSLPSEFLSGGARKGKGRIGTHRSRFKIPEIQPSKHLMSPFERDSSVLERSPRVPDVPSPGMTGWTAVIAHSPLFAPTC